MLLAILVASLTIFFLISTRSPAVYKINYETGKREISYRALSVITLIVVGIWYVLYVFFSKDTNDFDF